MQIVGNRQKEKMKIFIVDYFFKVRAIHLYISSYIREEVFLPSDTKHFVCALIPTPHMPLILFLLPLTLHWVFPLGR